MTIARKLCRCCQQETKHVSSSAVGLHIVLTLLSGGLWLLPLLIILLTGAGSKWHCDVCGYEWKRGPQRNQERLTPHQMVKRRRENPDFGEPLDPELDDDISSSLENRFGG